jgi:hypothetical protein
VSRNLNGSGNCDVDFEKFKALDLNFDRHRLEPTLRDCAWDACESCTAFSTQINLSPGENCRHSVNNSEECVRYSSEFGDQCIFYSSTNSDTSVYV